ncbi:unnamed protein product [Rhizophagus irregularis]|nr:unnamed protein product [Rhizophagus irregularis]CAB5390350.1 unnamed protein product [Rhizophagus irregularis]
MEGDWVFGHVEFFILVPGRVLFRTQVLGRAEFRLGCMDFGKIQKISFFRRRVWTSEFGDFSCRILDTDCSSAVYRRVEFSFDP